ncbi:hypothetical protein GB928_024940, partial [Shinella curvata]
ERVRRPPEAPPLSFDGRVIGPLILGVNSRFHKKRENRQVIDFVRLFNETRTGEGRNRLKTCVSAI